MSHRNVSYTATFVKKKLFIVLLVCLLQHPYVYLVLIFEAFATFIGQLSVLSLIALFGAATTAMVSASFEFLILLQ